MSRGCEILASKNFRLKLKLFAISIEIHLKIHGRWLYTCQKSGNQESAGNFNPQGNYNGFDDFRDSSVYQSSISCGKCTPILRTPCTYTKLLVRTFFKEISLVHFLLPFSQIWKNFPAIAFFRARTFDFLAL